MRVSVLGPLEVAADHKVVEIGGTKLRALLIRLAVDVGHPVSADSLVDAVWPEAAPAHPAAALQSLVWRLRQALPDERIVRSGSGWYQLDLPLDAVDSHRFERLAGAGQRALRAGDVDLARQRLREALALWRGDPLIEVADAPYAVATGVRLRELWLTAVEDRVEADLAVEPAWSLGAELAELTAAYPLRERLCVLLMRALDADGRRAEALAVYERMRRRLADELGSDPGAELQRTHLALLRGNRPERDRPRGNLRAPMTSFVGRAGELARIRERLREGRLVTLVGPGGVGKTRLATAFAAGVTDRIEGGTWLVELAPVAAAGDVARAVLAAVGPREVGPPASSGDPLRRLTEVLAPSAALLVLDNCEHVVGAAARLVDELLARCPRLLVVATSREPLGVAGERLCPVEPLPLPEPGEPAEKSPAVRLFADRAAAVRPDFVLSDDAAIEVADVCRRLDGLPLAIELAAVRLRTMALGQLATRLDDPLRVLAGGARSAPERHRTLRAVVAWSWDLLTGAERAQAARLAVFPSSFTAEAADRVGVAWETLDTLVDKSLLHLVGERYRMLATIREYGLERLAASGLADSVRAAHAAWFLDLAERAARHLRGAGQLRWLGVLTVERDNLLAALRFAADAGDAATARRLAAALGLFWAILGGHAEAADRLHTALTVPGPASATHTAVAAQYLFHTVLAGRAPDTAAVACVAEPDDVEQPDTTLVTALLALIGNDIRAGLTAIDRHGPPPDPWQRGISALVRAMLTGAASDISTMRRDLAAAAAAFRESGERWGLATSLTYLGLAEGVADDVDTAESALGESIRLIRQLGGTDHVQRAWLAMMHAQQGRLEEARADLLAILDEGVPSTAEALTRLFLADLARHRGELTQAAAELDLAAGWLGDGGFNDALLRLGQGHLALASNDLDAAGPRLREAFGLASSLPDMPMVAQVAVGVAELTLRRGAAGDAATVLGAAHALRNAAATGQLDVRRLSQELRTTLGPTAYRDAYDQGRHLDRDAALAAVAGQLGC
ncbi:ATP-binding protein [Amycolatopsis taiwanensis]|uniref:ATP-binding protein n=1 Tax=Amycolatopsis taiwanensis TaxID=342230 RepID=UPI00047F3E54|nr:BTAD domain-containing putative transcriptional regulator [Amycolatopsis taiwanensis]